VFAGLAYWGVHWFNEICNSLVFHFTQYAPVWGVQGNTSYKILIGLNIEITMMFAFIGITTAKTLPADKKMNILGIGNRVGGDLTVPVLSHHRTYLAYPAVSPSVVASDTDPGGW